MKINPFAGFLFLFTTSGHVLLSQTASTASIITGIGEDAPVFYTTAIRTGPCPQQFTAYSSSEKINELRISDLNGKQLMILDCQGKSERSFDLGGYPAGIYVVELQLETQAVRSRVIKSE